jgi:transposase
MDSPFAKRLVSDALWQLIEPLLPPHGVRSQGGGLRPIDDRAVFAAVAYMVTTGTAWSGLPSAFGVSKATAHRRFAAWTAAGVWENLQVSGLPAAERTWAEAIRCAALARAGADRHLARARTRPSETTV